jgi:hypothetical protein
MRCKMFIFLFGLIALLKGYSLFAVGEDLVNIDMNKKSECHSESYILPLSYDEDPPLLVIPIPQSFRLAFDGSSYPDVMYLEFVPQDENIKYWSEQITICQSTEASDAHVFIKAFKSVMEETHSLHSYPNYTSYIRCALERGIKVGYYISEHPAMDLNRLGIQAPCYNEMIEVKIVQGEDRIWVIQYAMRYNARTLTNDQHEKMLDKIQSFFDTCKVSSNVTGSPI